MWEGTLRPKTNSHQPKNSPPSYRKRKWCHSTVSLIIAISAQVGHASAFLATRSPATSMPILRHADVYKSKNHLGRVHVKSKQSWYRPATSLRYASVFQSIPISWFYLCALAIQFGIQPLLTKAYAPSGIIRSTFVMAQDLVRFFTCWLTLVVGGTWHLAVQNWSWQGALVAAGIPSVLYMIQNYFTLIAYQALPPVTFNILNQTKTLSAALCCYLILGQKQSTIQIMALFLLLLSALVIEKIVPLPWIDSNKSDTTETESSQTKDDNKRERKIAAGVVPVLIASFISGLGK